jgi:hypothetical protein
MSDLTRISQLASDLRERIHHLEEELKRLAGAGGARSLERSAAPGAGALFDLSKAVPPTPAEEPQGIVGGMPTSDFPDCCCIGDDTGFFCSATLIAPNLVISAKHCQGVTRVFLKGDNIAQTSTGEIIRVKKQHEHPTEDLRVLVLENNSTVTPRPVATNSDLGATSCTLVGFGTVDFDGTLGFGRKRKVSVPIISIGCAGPGDAAKFGCKPGKELVAGHRGLKKDSCRGDSGGPLYVQNAAGKFVLLGVTSRGTLDGTNVCGDGGNYVRADQFRDWIKQETGIQV